MSVRSAVSCENWRHRPGFYTGSQAYYLQGMVPPLPPAAFTAAKPGVAALGGSGFAILGASVLILAGLVSFNLLPRPAGERSR